MNAKSKVYFTSIIGKALKLQKQWGTLRAAGYLRNRGFSLTSALLVLVSPRVRAQFTS
jgi:hypothetical protein